MDCMFQMTERPTSSNQMDLVVFWCIDCLTVIDCNMDYNMCTFLQLNSSPRGASLGIAVCWSSLARQTCSKIMGTQKGYRIRMADQSGGTKEGTGTISIHYYTIWGKRGLIVPKIGSGLLIIFLESGSTTTGTETFRLMHARRDTASMFSGVEGSSEQSP